ncbi:hypothetical protein BC829DRAFT_441517 [Chytridium lagenaria]|nr:hypothetical protein BC829DRAFT_441517 [Chytridium lagenaria]
MLVEVGTSCPEVVNVLFEVVTDIPFAARGSDVLIHLIKGGSQTLSRKRTAVSHRRLFVDLKLNGLRKVVVDMGKRMTVWDDKIVDGPEVVDNHESGGAGLGHAERVGGDAGVAGLVSFTHHLAVLNEDSSMFGIVPTIQSGGPLGDVRTQDKTGGLNAGQDVGKEATGADDVAEAREQDHQLVRPPSVLLAILYLHADSITELRVVAIHEMSNIEKPERREDGERPIPPLEWIPGPPSAGRSYLQQVAAERQLGGARLVPSSPAWGDEAEGSNGSHSSTKVATDFAVVGLENSSARGRYEALAEIWKSLAVTEVQSKEEIVRESFQDDGSDGDGDQVEANSPKDRDGFAVDHAELAGERAIVVDGAYDMAGDLDIGVTGASRDGNILSQASLHGDEAEDSQPCVWFVVCSLLSLLFKGGIGQLGLNAADNLEGSGSVALWIGCLRQADQEREAAVKSQAPRGGCLRGCLGEAGTRAVLGVGTARFGASSTKRAVLGGLIGSDQNGDHSAGKKLGSGMNSLGFDGDDARGLRDGARKNDCGGSVTADGLVGGGRLTMGLPVTPSRREVGPEVVVGLDEEQRVSGLAYLKGINGRRSVGGLAEGHSPEFELLRLGDSIVAGIEVVDGVDVRLWRGLLWIEERDRERLIV